MPEDEFAVVKNHWEAYDFFFIHIKKPDSLGEDGDFQGKAKIIESVDKVLPTLLDLNPDVLIITGDHSTPSRMRYHSFLKYFGTLKKLGWVEETSEMENSAMQDHYPDAPDRVYYRLTEAGRKATDEEWSNPLFTMYPEIGANHKSRNTGWPHRKVQRNSGG